jgi:hypothetical protein
VNVKTTVIYFSDIKGIIHYKLCYPKTNIQPHKLISTVEHLQQHIHQKNQTLAEHVNTALQQHATPHNTLSKAIFWPQNKYHYIH